MGPGVWRPVPTSSCHGNAVLGAGSRLRKVGDRGNKRAVFKLKTGKIATALWGGVGDCALAPAANDARSTAAGSSQAKRGSFSVLFVQ